MDRFNAFDVHTRTHTGMHKHTLYQALHQYYCLDYSEHLALMLTPPPYTWNLNFAPPPQPNPQVYFKCSTMCDVLTTAVDCIQDNLS